MHALRVLRAFLAVGLLNIVQYRSDFAISVLNAAISLAIQVLGLSVVFANTADLRGWTSDDLLVLIGIHFFISGLIGLVMRPSMEALMEGVRLGTFDFLLTKPADSQLLASAQVVAPQAVTDVAVGVGVVIYRGEPDRREPEPGRTRHSSRSPSAPGWPSSTASCYCSPAWPSGSSGSTTSWSSSSPCSATPGAGRCPSSRAGCGPC